MKFLGLTTVAFASFGSAVQYYGFTPSINQYSTIEGYAATLSELGYELVSVLGTNDHQSPDAIKFLSSANIYNTTLREAFPSRDAGEIMVRADTTQVTCTTAKVTDQLSSTAVTQICMSLATIAGGTYGSITMLIYSKTCADKTNGAGTFCNILLGFFAGGGAFLVPSEVYQYCPNFLNLFSDKCQNQGGTVQDTASGIEATESISQLTRTCGDVSGPCTSYNQ